MKKLLFLLLNFVFLFTLCACDSNIDTQVNVEKNDSMYITAKAVLSEKYKKLSVLNEFITDINLDGKDDKITLYTAAEISDDEVYINDGNTLVLIVSDGAESKFYELFSDYVQLGNVHFQVADYFRNGKPIPTITLYESTGAGLKIMNFTFEEGKGFLKENIYDSSEKSDSGINLKYSTIPIY